MCACSEQGQSWAGAAAAFLLWAEAAASFPAVNVLRTRLLVWQGSLHVAKGLVAPGRR